MANDFSDVVLLAQTVIRGEMGDQSLARGVISDAVDRVLALNPRWRNTIDRDAVVRELETRFDVWIGQD
jgi:hypothetical protein